IITHKTLSLARTGPPQKDMKFTRTQTSAVRINNQGTGQIFLFTLKERRRVVFCGVFGSVRRFARRRDRSPLPGRVRKTVRIRWPYLIDFRPSREGNSDVRKSSVSRTHGIPFG